MNLPLLILASASPRRAALLRAMKLEFEVVPSDIAEAASWVRGVDRTGPRELRIRGEDALATYRSFCAAILLTRTVAETV